MTRRLRLAGIGLALVAVVGLAGFLFSSVSSARELAQARRDYVALFGEPDLSALGPAEPNADDNVATWFTAGARALVRFPDGLDPRGFRRTPASEWSAETRQFAEEVIATNRPAFELLERAVGCSSSSFGIEYEDGAYARVPDFLELLDAHKLVSTRARLRLAAGDLPAFRSDLALMAHLADALAAESLLISSVFVLSLDLDYLDLLEDALETGLSDSPWLEQIRSTLEGMHRREVVWRALRSEGAVADVIATHKVQDAMPELVAIFGPTLPGVLSRPAVRRLQASFLRGPVDAASWIDRPYGDWLEQGTDPESRSLAWEGNSWDPHPHLMKAIGRLQAGETARLLALEAVRLSRARADTGSYPAESRLPAVDPFAGSPCRREVDDHQAIVLECPGARKLFETGVGRRRTDGANLFRWRLGA